MDLTFWIVTICLLPMMPVSAQQNNLPDQLAKAHELYEQGDFEGAFVLYKVMSNKSAAVWYNMGNAAFKNKRYTQAIACWYRAMREGGPSFVDDCLYNINAAYTKMGITQRQSWKDMVLASTGYPSLLFFQLIFLLFWYLISVACIVLKGRYRVMCVSVLLMCLSVETAGLVAAHSFWNEDQCIMCEAKVPVHVGPDSRFVVTNKIEKASRAQIIEERNGWYNVTTGEVSGWVSAEHVVLV